MQSNSCVLSLCSPTQLQDVGGCKLDPFFQHIEFFFFVKWAYDSFSEIIGEVGVILQI